MKSQDYKSYGDGPAAKLLDDLVKTSQRVVHAKNAACARAASQHEYTLQDRSAHCAAAALVALCATRSLGGLCGAQNLPLEGGGDRPTWAIRFEDEDLLEASGSLWREALRIRGVPQDRSMALRVEGDALCLVPQGSSETVLAMLWKTDKWGLALIRQILLVLASLEGLEVEIDIQGGPADIFTQGTLLEWCALYDAFCAATPVE